MQEHWRQKHSRLVYFASIASMETDTKCVLGVQEYGWQKLLMLAIDMHNTVFFSFCLPTPETSTSAFKMNRPPQSMS